MKNKRFSVEQIVAVLKQAELGLPVADQTLMSHWVSKRRCARSCLPTGCRKSPRPVNVWIHVVSRFSRMCAIDQLRSKGYRHGRYRPHANMKAAGLSTDGSSAPKNRLRSSAVADRHPATACAHCAADKPEAAHHHRPSRGLRYGHSRLKRESGKG